MTALTAFACGFLAGLGALAALWLHDTGAPHFVAWVSSWFEATELDDTDLVIEGHMEHRFLQNVRIVNNTEES